ncbi:solute carrier family 25 member 48 isoform X2 [Oenanthe melanoleuca]|uniref:solute carrier family 25 member 48 isoform X2 n=1 Tax=Oenanthe melanoleuca TaxID=2939378 RepID=UPI0024C1C60C|nr:solute carrier family 25 member 48 isoform X2 [Oenanthe melanoleuca]
MGSVQLQDFVAGLVGGIASVVAGHPLDTVKTRMQAGQGYGNTLKCILTVYRNESLAGFFKGMSFPLASIGVYSSVVFGVFSGTQRWLARRRHGDAPAAPALADVALASVVAGGVSVGIGTPVELVKIRLQMQTQPYAKEKVQLNSTAPGSPVYRGPIHCLRTILEKEGIAGIYRGNVAMLLRDIPGYCAYFIPYAMFCDWITPDGSLSPNAFTIWMAGGVAGAVSWAVSTPMDVVKSRLQADGVYSNQYKGTLDCMLQSYQNEGLKCCQEDKKVSCFPEPAQQCGVGELSCSDQRLHPAPAAAAVGSWPMDSTNCTSAIKSKDCFTSNFSLLTKNTLITPVVVVGFFSNDIFSCGTRKTIYFPFPRDVPRPSPLQITRESLLYSTAL